MTHVQKLIKYTEKNVCEFNKEQQVMIFHFTNKILTNTKSNKNITYVRHTTDKISNKIDILRKECKNINILVVIDFIDFPDKHIIKNLNDALDKLNGSDDSLQNITIINLTNDSTKVLYQVLDKTGKRIFKKIINVFPIGEELKTPTKDFFKNLSINQSIENFVNSNMKYSDTMYTLKFNDGSKKIIDMRLMSTKSKSINLIEQWWYLWYFNVPPCANVRLTQSTGTCWLNTAINSLILPKEIASILIDQYMLLSKETREASELPLQNFNCQTCKLSTLLNSLVYNLLINKTKAKKSDGNFVGVLAARIKCESSDTNTQKCFDIKYGDSWDSGYGVKIILKHILNQNIYSFIDIVDNENKAVTKCLDNANILFDKINVKNNKRNDSKRALNTTNNESKLIVKEYNKNLKNPTKLLELKEQLNELKLKISHLKKIIDDYDAQISKLKIDYKTAIDIFNKRTQLRDINLKDSNDYDIEKYIQISGNPKLIVVKGHKKTAKTSLMLNGKLYKLCSAGLSLNINHAIVGIVCNKKYYVYDSNNIIAETNWYKNDINNYLTNDSTKELYKNHKEIKLLNINYVVYILQN
jgi:hypothetical protein